MAAGKRDSRRPASGYLQRTHRPINCLMFLLPLLVAYEVGALFLGQRLLVTRHLRELLEVFGATGRWLPAVVVVVSLLIWHVASRQRWRIDGEALLGMLAESVLLTAPLVLLMVATQKALSADAGGADAAARTAEKVLQGIGAGIYEEFLFRLATMGALLVLFVDVMQAPRRISIAVTITLASVLFSLYHFLGPDTFRWDLFVLRALAGAYLGGVYLTRGYGIAAGAHAWYNVVLALVR